MKRAAGFTIVSAVFLMVVLAVLGVSLVNIATVQHTTSAQLLQTVRASYAARAGAEWAAWQAANTVGWCPGPYPMSFTVTLPAPLAGFGVTVECTRTDHTVNAAVQRYFVVDVTAASGSYGTPDFARRRLQIKVRRP